MTHQLVPQINIGRNTRIGFYAALFGILADVVLVHLLPGSTLAAVAGAIIALLAGCFLGVAAVLDNPPRDPEHHESQ